MPLAVYADGKLFWIGDLQGVMDYNVCSIQILTDFNLEDHWNHWKHFLPPNADFVIGEL